MTLLTSIPEHLFLLGAAVLVTSMIWWVLLILTRKTQFSQLQHQASKEQQDLRLSVQAYEQKLLYTQNSLESQRQQSQHYAEQLDALRAQTQTLSAQHHVMVEKLENRTSEVEVLSAKHDAYERLLSEHAALKVRSEAEHQSLAEQLKLLNESKQQLANQFESLAAKIFDEKQQAFTRQSQATIDASVSPLKDQLKDFREKIENVYGKEAAERNQLVGQIAELQKQTQRISADAINLTNAIKGDNKTQGNWGEVILERLLEESGLQKGREYDLQVGLKSEDGGRRNPDVIIRLPENKDIVIDSKVSLAHYEKYFSAEDELEKGEYLKQHINSLRTHIKQLSSKSYENLEGIRTLDFVFLFVPVESAFMLALQTDPGLFREAYDKHIVLVSPTTLLATLRTVENIWRYEKQNKNAEDIARQAGGLYDQFVLLTESFEDIGKQIEKASDAYELTQKRLMSGRGNLIGRVEKLRELGAKTKKQFSQSARAALELNSTDD